MSYPGGKEGPGVWHRIVNLMPPHEVYVELFAGGGAVLRNKPPAPRSIALDVDAGALAALEERMRAERPLDVVEFLELDALAWLRTTSCSSDMLLYADPPYPLSVRRSDRVRYARDLTDDEHVDLLELLTTTGARAMVSGYRCPIYDAWLSAWHRVDYKAMTRGGYTVDESLWLNFPPPAALHGYDRVGADYRERERIKKKRRRWLAMFSAMPEHERAAIFSDLSHYQNRKETA